MNEPSMGDPIGQARADELRWAADVASDLADTENARMIILRMRKTTLEILETRAVGYLDLPFKEEAQAAEILNRVERELAPLEERTQRLMQQYGI